MTIVRIGSNEKYANGWDLVFGGKTKSAATAAKKKASAKKKPAGKKAGKKK